MDAKLVLNRGGNDVIPFTRVAVGVQEKLRNEEHGDTADTLGRTFDLVFVHDAVMYMVTEDDLIAILKALC